MDENIEERIETAAICKINFKELINSTHINRENAEVHNTDTTRFYEEVNDDPDLVVGNIAAEIDETNPNIYLDATISSNLLRFDFNWPTECFICSLHFDTFQNLLDHCFYVHENEFGEFNCIFIECEAILADHQRLARHFILAHSDLSRLQIYSCCQICHKRFTNVSELNKHTCYRKLSRKAGRSNYCVICKQDFASFKRFNFHLQFHLAKHRPKACLICSKEFDDINELFIHVSYSHEPSNSMICTRCDLIFQERQAFETHQRFHTHKSSRANFKCNTCSKTFQEKLSLLAHQEAMHSNNDEYECKICHKIFITEIHLERHNKQHHAETGVEAFVCIGCGAIQQSSEALEKSHANNPLSLCYRAKIVKEFLVEAYGCLHCDMNFKEVDDLKNHRFTGIHDNGKYVCPECGTEFDSRKFMRLHLRSHTKYKSLTSSLQLKRKLLCDGNNCEHIFSTWTALQRHKSRHHSPNKCPQCKLFLPNDSEYESHAINCKPVTRFICQFCEKEYPTKMSLSVHISRSHNNNQAICPHCQSCHQDEQKLQTHIENFHVPIECKYCSKTFKSKNYMKTHLCNVHNDGRQLYFCKYCNKGFLFRCRRDRHEKDIHAEITHKCTVCNFVTSYPKSLELHMQRHNKNYKFLCTQCGRAFNREQSFKLHMQRHMGGKKFVCSERIVNGCDAAFISNYLLNKHIKAKHVPKLKRQKITQSLMHENELTSEKGSNEDEPLTPANEFEIQLHEDMIDVFDEDGMPLTNIVVLEIN